MLPPRIFYCDTGETPVSPSSNNTAARIGYNQSMRHPTRRHFLKSAAAASIASAAIPSLAATETPATAPATKPKKLNLALIGIGGQGSWHLGVIEKIDIANITAL